MLEFLFADANLPFAIALGLVLGLALVELVGLMLGFGLSEALDGATPDVEFDLEPSLDASGDLIGAALSWLGFGRVPALIWVIILLSAFGLTGLVAQQTVVSVFGAPLPAWLAVIPAASVALPLTRTASKALAHVMPRETTEAISEANFIGKVAVITQGVARVDLPAQAKLKDRFGQTHYVLVRPETGDPDAELKQGAEVLIVQALGGGRYGAIPNPHPGLSQSSP
ncbi:MAG: YqiJ family protein [Maricaulaceae bacterium]